MRIYFLPVIIATISLASIPSNVYAGDKDVEYSINLLCINRDVDHVSPFICQKELFEQIAKSSKSWARLNPKATVTFWYDGSLASEAAISASQKEIEAFSIKNLRFADIKSIDFVSKNEDAFSAYMPLYFRIDFLKLVILANEITVHKNLVSAVFADATVKAMDEGKLLNQTVMVGLNHSGLTSNGLTENQFVQVISNDAVRSALRHTINVNLIRGVTLLNLDGRPRDFLSKAYASVFYSTHQKGFLGGFHSKFAAKRILVNKVGVGGEDKWKEYNEEEDGYLPFGNVFLGGKDYVVNWKGGHELDEAKQYVKYEGLEGYEMYKRHDIDVKPPREHTDEVKPKPEGRIFRYSLWP